MFFSEDKKIPVIYFIKAKIYLSESCMCGVYVMLLCCICDVVLLFLSCICDVVVLFCDSLITQSHHASVLQVIPGGAVVTPASTIAEGCWVS